MRRATIFAISLTVIDLVLLLGLRNILIFVVWIVIRGGVEERSDSRC